MEQEGLGSNANSFQFCGSPQKPENLPIYSARIDTDLRCAATSSISGLNKQFLGQKQPYSNCKTVALFPGDHSHVAASYREVHSIAEVRICQRPLLLLITEIQTLSSPADSKPSTTLALCGFNLYYQTFSSVFSLSHSCKGLPVKSPTSDSYLQ